MAAPISVWAPTSGIGEYSLGSTSALVDTAGIAVVDTAGVAIIDTVVVFTDIPKSTWSRDDGS